MSDLTVHPLDELRSIAKKENLDIDDRSFAEKMDALDPLQAFRKQFYIPTVNDIRKARHGSTSDTSPHPRGNEECLYFTGNSLGLQSKKAESYVLEELKKWQREGVTGHFNGKSQWLTIDELVTDQMAKLVGAKPIEVAVMNTLTTNLHLMMVAFYTPTKDRFKIMLETGPFPSDWYAAESQVKFHGFDPEEALVWVKPRENEHTLRTEDIIATMDKHDFALILLPGVQYATGQLLDIETITKEAHKRGAMVGFDLAHAAGNVPLKLHDWEVDFAVWCSYKYLCSGPGGIGGCFVHEKHAHKELNRFAGWWGHDLKTRFGMKDRFTPIPGAFGFRLSNPCTFPVLTLKATLEIVNEAGFENMRKKSLLLTGYLEYLLEKELPEVKIITPKDPLQRGCQLSLHVAGLRLDAKQLEQELYSEGVVCDARGETILRVSPHPLWNTFQEVFDFVSILKKVLSS